jgi:hypothetical protein
MPRHRERSERHVWSPEVHTRFEPSHLAEVCLADAYARLVPPVRRQVGTSPGARAFGLDQRSSLRETWAGREEGREEGRQCS